jgi:cytochrome c biogenesis protein
MILSAKNRTPLTAVWDFFCSLKLTISTLILLAVTSIIGTVIQQNLSPTTYKQIYGQTTFRVLNDLKFFDMYHSWWFLALLGIFSLNLIACSLKRLPRVLKTVREPVLVPGDTLYRTLSCVEEEVVKKPLAETRDQMVAFVAKNFSRPVITEEGDKVHLFAQKGAYARFGVYVTHLSILIIFVGAILGSLWGFKGFVNINVGNQTRTIRNLNTGQPIHLGFAVRCDAFDVTFYPGTRRPKEFRSELTFLQNGKPVSPALTKHPILVNDPVTYKGITFYQASYGISPNSSPTFNFRVQDRATGQTVRLHLHLGQRVALPGGSSFEVADFSPAFQNFGPAARLNVFPDKGAERSFVVLQDHPNFDVQRGGDYIFSMLSFKQPYYTGLQVAKDPGVWVVWTGCFLLILGCLVAFFLSHRRLWVTIQPVGKKTGIKIGGSAHRNQAAFELTFEELKKKLKTELTA